MKYAIIGSGAIGTALARQFARKGIEVAVANARGPETIQPLVEELGSAIVPSEVSEAIQADVVILAVPYEAAVELGQSIPDWNGRIIVDTTNALDYSDFSALDLGGRLSTDVIAEAAQGARVVKGFNHLWARVLGREADDGRGHGHRVMFVSGNDQPSKDEILELMKTFGFTPIDLGRVDEGGVLSSFGGPLTRQSFVEQEIGGASAPEMDLIHA